ncbi:MAG: MBL fold metallo-hydrolase [Patescibacteria group bacterium]
MKKRLWVSWACVVLVALITVTILSISRDNGRYLRVSFLDVGQGDAIFIESPTGYQVLIDGGRDRSVLRELSREMHWYDRSIDLVIATHPDSDHISGLNDILDRYRVAEIFDSGVVHDAPAAISFRKKSQAEGARMSAPLRGQVVDIGGGAYIEILFPDRPVPHLETNTASIVVRVVYGATSFMLTGDSPQVIEEYLVYLDGSALQSTVLKAGHHGSRTSSSPQFVATVAPTYAVYSRGCDNSYGHPHKEVVAIFTQIGVQVRDTCTDSRVTFISNGSTLIEQ